jgi:predicted ArsR family transcriptional regulator
VSSANTSKTTRRAVVELLKWNGPMTAAALGEALSVSAVAVRRHLDALEGDGIVDQATRSSGRGRPAHVYRLTPLGDDQFPRNYDQLVLQLLHAAVAEFGGDAVERLLAQRGRALAARYADRTAGLELPALAAVLARIQDENGYMAECETGEDGEFVLREHNCAIPAIAGRHPAACQQELQLLRTLAGPDVDLERIAHIRSGDPVCAYRLAVRGRLADPAEAP